jgi:hypothetical protein
MTNSFPSNGVWQVFLGIEHKFYEFNEGCRSAIGEGQDPEEEARLIQSAKQAYWWVAKLRSKLFRARQL